MNHTPGPWGATTRQGSWDWVVFSEVDPNVEICQMFHDDTEFNERGEANSRLVAAAPELFEIAKACDAILRTNTHILIKHDDPQEAKDGFLNFGRMVQRVLAKAEGKS